MNITVDFSERGTLVIIESIQLKTADKFQTSRLSETTDFMTKRSPVTVEWQYLTII